MEHQLLSTMPPSKRKRAKEKTPNRPLQDEINKPNRPLKDEINQPNRPLKDDLINQPNRPLKDDLINQPNRPLKDDPPLPLVKRVRKAPQKFEPAENVRDQSKAALSAQRRQTTQGTQTVPSTVDQGTQTPSRFTPMDTEQTAPQTQTESPAKNKICAQMPPDFATREPPHPLENGEDLCHVCHKLVMNSVEHLKGRGVSAPVAEAAACLGLSARTILNVRKRMQTAPNAAGRRRKRVNTHRRWKDNLDEMTLWTIRLIVHRHFFKKKIHPTVREVFKVVKEQLGKKFDYKEEVLRQVLQHLGFRYKKRNNDPVIYERPDLVQKRIRFERRYMAFRALGKKFVITDETWLLSSCKTPRTWQDVETNKDPRNFTQPGSDLCSGPSAPLSKGKRLMITHALKEGRLVKGARSILHPKSDGPMSYDPHKEMNAEKFERWFFAQLLPNLEPGQDVIILDNAPYHSRMVEKAPTSASKKKDMQDWLNANNIKWELVKKDPVTGKSRNIRKDELYKKYIQPIRSNYCKYYVDEQAAAMGFEVLRLPPYHCLFAAIEFVWKDYKNNVNKRNEHNTSNKLDVCEKIAHEEFEKLEQETPENYKLLSSYEKHCDRVILKHCKMDGVTLHPEAQAVVVPIDSDPEPEDSSDDDRDADDEDSDEY